MSKYLKHSIFLIISLLSLLNAGCGFHLQGYGPQQGFTLNLSTIYIQSSTPYSPLVHELTRELNQLGSRVVNTAGQAPVTLVILTDSFSNSQVSIAGSQETRQYNIIYTVTIALNNSQGEQIYGPVTLTQTGTDTVLANQVLGNNGELDAIEDQLRDQMISSIMYRLTSQQAKAAIEKANTQYLHSPTNAHSSIKPSTNS